LWNSPQFIPVDSSSSNCKGKFVEKGKIFLNYFDITVDIVRYCRIKTTPHVERKDLLEIQTAELPLHPPHPEIREQRPG
jgi:hypothetical protein